MGELSLCFEEYTLSRKYSRLHIDSFVEKVLLRVCLFLAIVSMLYHSLIKFYESVLKIALESRQNMSTTQHKQLQIVTDFDQIRHWIDVP